jgi:hypothetical protein
MDDLTELFEILDADGSGELTIDEFVSGICKLVTTNCPLDQVRMEKNITVLRNEMKDVKYYVARNEDNLRREIRELHNLILRQANLPPLQIPQPETLLTSEALVPNPQRIQSIIVEDKFAKQTRKSLDATGLSASAH